MPGDDDLEVAVEQGPRLEHPPALVYQASVGVLRDYRRFVVEADPRRGHHIGVDVIEKIADIEVLHAQVHALVELLANQLEIFGQEEHPLACRQPYSLRGPLLRQGYTTFLDASQGCRVFHRSQSFDYSVQPLSTTVMLGFLILSLLNKMVRRDSLSLLAKVE